MIQTPTAASLDVDEAAAFLGLHPDTLRERAAAGIIPGAKPGKEWRFLDVDLIAYLRGKYCRSTDESTPPSGTSTFATAADALDDLLGLPIGPKRKGSTTSLQLVLGKSARTAKRSTMPCSPGTRRNRGQPPRTGQ